MGTTEPTSGPTPWATHANHPADPTSLTALTTTDPDTLTGAELIDAITASEKALSLLTGIQHRLLAAFAQPFTAGDPTRLATRLARKNRPHDDPTPEQIQALLPDAAISLAGTEIAAALRISPVTAGLRVRDAITMTTTLAPTLQHLEHGTLDRGKARVIADHCQPLTETHTTAVQNLVLPAAATLTTSELRDLTGQAVITIDPHGADERHHTSAARRTLTLKALPDAMATLSAYLPADGAVKLFQISDLLATSTAACPGDTRGIGARRVDALIDIAEHLLTHGHLDLTNYLGQPLPDPDTAVDNGDSTTNSDSTINSDSSTNGDTPTNSRTPNGTVTDAESTPASGTDPNGRTATEPDPNPTGDTDTNGSTATDAESNPTGDTDPNGSTATDAESTPPGDTDTNGSTTTDAESTPPGDSATDADRSPAGDTDTNGSTTTDSESTPSGDGATNATAQDVAARASTDPAGTEVVRTVPTDQALSTPAGPARPGTAGTVAECVRPAPRQDDTSADVHPAAGSPADTNDTSSGGGLPGSASTRVLPAGTPQDQPVPPLDPRQPSDPAAPLPDPEQASVPPVHQEPDDRSDDRSGDGPGDGPGAGAGTGHHDRPELPTTPPSARASSRSARTFTRQGRRPHLSVTLGLGTLAGIDNLPGTLDGFGAIPPGLARSIALSAATITALLTDHDTGTTTHAGSLTYRPRQELRDQIAALLGTCQFPSCRQPVWRCDIDHREPFDHTNPDNGGPTDLSNTGPYCRRHHLIKHHTDWRIRPDRNRYVLHFTSPTGHHYTKRQTPTAPPAIWLETPGAGFAERLDNILTDTRENPVTPTSIVEELLTTTLLQHHLTSSPMEYSVIESFWANTSQDSSSTEDARRGATELSRSDDRSDVNHSEQEVDDVHAEDDPPPF